MITSDIIKIKYTNDNEEIEKNLKDKGLDVLRWAVVEVLEEELALTVSYIA